MNICSYVNFIEDKNNMNIKKIILDERLHIIIATITLILGYFQINIGPINLCWISILLCGIPIIIEALEALITEQDITADFLVALAIIASIIIGEPFAAGEIAVIMAIGELLEHYTVHKSQKGIKKLIKLNPTTARTIQENTETIIPAEKVPINTLIKILPGETIPIDGIITQGQTTIDQSVLTGEPIPADKTINDEVYSGTVNQLGSIIIKTNKLGKDSSLQKMIQLVKSADASKSKIVKQADKWAVWIVITALIVSALTYFITGEIIRSVTVLVVFCPCAFVLATPTAIMASIGNLTKYGILVKEGDAIEKLSHVKKIIFDKTGTITHGKPELTHIIPENITETKLLTLTASLENQSEHPLAKSIVKYAKTQNIPLETVTDFEMIIGQGVTGKINDQKISAGNTQLISLENIPDELDTYLNQGSTIIYVSLEDEYIGALILEDTLRDDANQVINQLENTNLETILATGDNTKSAHHIAEKAGIINIYPNCLPEDKMKIIDDEQAKGYPVAMIGDGINDAPSLKKSCVGIAMGGVGSDIAIEAADIALTADNIEHIPHLMGLSRKTMRTINLNLSFALGLNFLAMFLAILGVLGPVGGALLHNVGSVLVIINSALLLHWTQK